MRMRASPIQPGKLEAIQNAFAAVPAALGHFVQHPVMKDVSVISDSCCRIQKIVKSSGRTIRILLGHDIGGALQTLPSQVGEALHYAEDRVEWQEVVADLLARVQVVSDAIGALVFWTLQGGVLLPVQPINLKSFFDKHKHLLQLAFCGVDQDAKTEIQNPDNLMVVGHEATLGNLLMNMARNARFRGNAKILLVRAGAGYGHGMIEVMDDGSGVPDQVAPRIFEWRFTGSEGGRGIGLGLADKRIAAMGGALEIEPHGGIKNRGAKFTIRLKNIDRASGT